MLNLHYGRQTRHSDKISANDFSNNQAQFYPEFQADGKDYFPPTYEKDGFIHATKDPQLLLGIANHFYKYMTLLFNYCCFIFTNQPAMVY